MWLMWDLEVRKSNLEKLTLVLLYADTNFDYLSSIQPWSSCTTNAVVSFVLLVFNTVLLNTSFLNSLHATLKTRAQPLRVQVHRYDYDYHFCSENVHWLRITSIYGVVYLLRRFFVLQRFYYFPNCVYPNSPVNFHVGGNRSAWRKPATFYLSP